MTVHFDIYVERKEEKKIYKLKRQEIIKYICKTYLETLSNIIR